MAQILLMAGRARRPEHRRHAGTTQKCDPVAARLKHRLKMVLRCSATYSATGDAMPQRFPPLSCRLHETVSAA